MNITDVPDSAIYLQVGAITQLVVEIQDVNTGDPVQLQTATGMTISILYPDGTTARDLPAALYTDGSDGRIAYTTHNDGASDIDLTQWGKYRIQGWATLGGVQLPPSSRSDFYVLPNNDDTGQPPIAYTSSALILFTVDDIRTAMTVDTLGDLHFTARLVGPSNSLTLSQFVLQDSDGVYWIITADGAGSYTSTPGGTFDNALEQLILLDSNSHGWIITISTAGVLSAA